MSGDVERLTAGVKGGFVSNVVVAIIAWPVYFLECLRENVVLRFLALVAFWLFPLAIAVINLPNLQGWRELAEQQWPAQLSSLLFAPLSGFITSWFIFACALATYVAWSRSERTRLMISQGVHNQNPDDIADLSKVALSAVVPLALSIPLTLYFTNKMACGCDNTDCLFVDATKTFRPWGLMDVDLLLQLFPISIIHDLFPWNDFSKLVSKTMLAHQFAVIVRAAWPAAVIAIIYGYISITNSIRSAVIALRAEYELPIVKLGSRALPKLYEAIYDSLETSDEVESDGSWEGHAANAIGSIGNPKSLPVLALMAETDLGKSTPRKLAVRAMVSLTEGLKEKLAELTGRGVIVGYRRWKIRHVLRQYQPWAVRLLKLEEELLIADRNRKTKLLRKELGHLISSTNLT